MSGTSRRGWTAPAPPGGRGARTARLGTGGEPVTRLVRCCLIAWVATAGMACGRLPSQPDDQSAHDQSVEAEANPRRTRPSSERPPRAADDGPAAVRRLEPRGSPGPQAICGHAVALVGWQPGGAGGDVLLVHDPADNRLGASGRGDPPHDWRPQPLSLPVRYGARRPGLTLLPSAAYSVVGAVVVAPAAAAVPSRSGPVPAVAMPDLSQEFPGRGPGLCGPTSAADILYAIAVTRPGVLESLGPVPAANDGVASLVLGAGGLAPLMAIGDKDDGATNEGMRAGLEAWLGKADPGAWTVTLDWLAEEPRSREAQRRFLDRLAAAVAAGGGVVLCLWPGHDSPGANSVQAAPVGGPAEAGAGPPPAPGPAGGDQAAAVAAARRSLESARRSLQRGQAAEAVEAVGRAVEAVRRPAVVDPGCRACLDEALALAAEIDRRTSAAVPASLSVKPTNFE